MAAAAAKSAYLGWLAAVLTKGRMESRTSPAASNDLVLGYATGYDSSDIAPFVRSLRAVFDGDVALVVDDRPDVAALLQDYGVQALKAPAADGWSPHPVMARFAAYERHLVEHPGDRNVLLTDVRDVVFQGAPFLPAPTGLEVFLEDGALGDHAFNMKHLRAVAGEAIARGLADSPAICVGTVMGPQEEVIRLCRMVLMLAAIPRSGSGGAFGADQAACNLAIHLGLIPARICENHGRVATVGLTPPQRLSVKDGRILNPDGSVSAILHQHDRHPHLVAAVRGLWGQGLQARERIRPRNVAARARQLWASTIRRVPELR